MSIDKYRVNAWSAKRAIDEHLKGYQGEEPTWGNVDAIVLWAVLAMCGWVVIQIIMDIPK